MPIAEIQPFSSLQQYVPAWSDLISNAGQTNAFFEPWAFIPAWENLASITERCLFVFSSLDPSLLIGFIPVSVKSSYRHLPLRHMETWRHVHCFLSTPIVRAGSEHDFFRQLFAWNAEYGRSYFGFEFPYLDADGFFARSLKAFCQSTDQSIDCVESFDRAFLVPHSNPDRYLEAALKKKHRKDLDRKMELLQSVGEVEVHVLGAHEEGKAWRDTFLALESSGWKEEAGSAFATRASEKKFFEELMIAGAKEGRLIRQLMTVGGTPVCARVSLLSGIVALSFKIAYDESWSRYSPGMLLEVANLRWALSQTPPIAMDSCAAPNSEMFRRLWLDTCRIEGIFVSKTDALSRFIIRAAAKLIVSSRSFRKRLLKRE